MIHAIALPSLEQDAWHPGWRFPNGDLRIIEYSDHQLERDAISRAQEMLDAGFAQDIDAETPGIRLTESFQPKEETTPMDTSVNAACEVPGFEYYSEPQPTTSAPGNHDGFADVPPTLLPRPLLPFDDDRAGLTRMRLIESAMNLAAAECHTRSFNAGWWIDPATGKPKGTVAEKLALIHSEVSEALEGDRKGLRDDKLPHRWMIEVELADAMIRILDLAGALALDVGGAMVEKMEYNARRDDHKLENRAAAGGKAY